MAAGDCREVRAGDCGGCGVSKLLNVIREFEPPPRRCWRDHLDAETQAELLAVREAWAKGAIALSMSEIHRLVVRELAVKIGLWAFSGWMKAGAASQGGDTACQRKQSRRRRK